jgi:hypothetical protein
MKFKPNKIYKLIKNNKFKGASIIRMMNAFLTEESFKNGVTVFYFDFFFHIEIILRF